MNAPGFASSFTNCRIRRFGVDLENETDDHRRVKSRVGPMLGFKRFLNARRVVARCGVGPEDRKRSVRCARKLRHGPVLYMVQHAGGVNLAPICNRSRPAVGHQRIHPESQPPRGSARIRNVSPASCLIAGTLSSAGTSSASALYRLSRSSPLLRSAFAAS